MDKGKSFMKKLRLSPDGYMQMSLQLAFYRLHKEIPKTYETGTTRCNLLYGTLFMFFQFVKASLTT